MITKEEFEAYVRVQEEGRYNMLSSSARIATGLPEDKYWKIIEHYDELAKKFG